MTDDPVKLLLFIEQNWKELEHFAEVRNRSLYVDYTYYTKLQVALMERRDAAGLSTYILDMLQLMRLE